MKFIVTTTAALMVASSCTPMPAFAQMVCGQRPRVLNELASKYHERPTAYGIANNGAAVELLKTEDGKTWSIIVTYPNGKSCALATGSDWEPVKAEYGVAN